MGEPERIGCFVYRVLANAFLMYCEVNDVELRDVEPWYDKVFREATLQGMDSEFNPKYFAKELRRRKDVRFDLLADLLERDFTLEGT